MSVSLFRTALAFAIALMLGGCVVGQSIEMVPASSPQASSAIDSQNIQVKDERTYVVSGDKAPYYIGKYRAGLGIPYDVTTDGNVPLSELIKSALTERLRTSGYEGSKVQIAVSIRDWNFDAYQNGKFTYDLMVSATAPGFQSAKTETLRETIIVKGTFMTGGKGGFERDMPGIFKRVMDRLVAPGSAVHDAMTSSPQ